MKIWRKILSVFFPERCPYCNKIIYHGELSCEDCSRGLIRHPIERDAVGGYRTISAVPYTEPYENGVWELKFRGAIQFAPQLAGVMAIAIKTGFAKENFDVITYVPLHKIRQKERGYNQSELLAKELSYLLELPLEDLLTKIKNNPPQHSTKASQRGDNVKNAYRIVDPKSVEGRKILLIDDIITTGNTLGECARMLRLSGADEIFCATFATVVAKTA